MNFELKLKTSPTKTDFEKVKKWLIDEYKTLNEGFYCNWSIIEKAFGNGNFVTIDLGGMPVGFIVWKKGEIYAEIDILEIKPDQRGKGIGNYFINEFSEFLRFQEIVAIKLFCSPRESERFWKKLGFTKFPERGYSESDLTYYKPLIEVLSNSNVDTEHKIELWNVDPYQIKDKLPKWTWCVELSEGKLRKPILQPCNCNWNLRWTKKGTIIKENKIKYFNSDENRIEFSPFLYIDKLTK